MREAPPYPPARQSPTDLEHGRAPTVGRLSSHRCPRCEIRRALCFCAEVPRIPLRTRLVILMHVGEQALTTNTARLAARALPNSEIRIRGRKDEPLSSAGLVEVGRHPLLLYPSSHAAVLDGDVVARLRGPVTLIVPDGSWAQAQKLVRREPALVGIPHVRLPEGPPSEYGLRRQSTEARVCTLEAVARALGILESREAQARMETVLRVMVERTLWSRGRMAAEQCSASGIPRDAFYT